MNPIRTRYLDVGGVRVYCRYSDGDGPAVVLLPGGMLDTSTLTWRYTLDALPPRWRVFAPDLPGYGRSAKPDVSYSTAYYVDFLAAFLDALGLRRAHLCGSSMTGAVVLGLALRAPERAASVVLSGAYGMQPRVPLHPLVYLLAHVPGLPVLTRAVLRGGPRVMRLALRFAVPDPRAIGSDLVRDACEGVAHDGQLRAFARWMRSEILPTRVRTDLTPRLPALAMPVLLLHGDRDWMMPARYARRAHALLPHSRLHVFAGAGHMVPRERPETVNRILTDFLREAAQQAG